MPHTPHWSTVPLPPSPPTLAQIFEPSLPGVPPTPVLEAWITGTGIPGAAVALVAAALALFVLVKSGKARAGWALAALLTALGIACLIAGQTITTTREHLAARTAMLIDAAANADGPALTDLLHPDIRVRTRFGSGEGRDSVIALSERASGYINGQSIKRHAIDPRGSQVARTMVTLRLDADNLPRLSQWTFGWQRETNTSPWRVVSIEPIWIQGIDNPAASP